MNPRLSANQKSYLAFITENPGTNAAEVCRAKKRNPQAGHKWVYQSLDALRRRGFISAGASRNGRGIGLYIAPLGAEAVAKASEVSQ